MRRIFQTKNELNPPISLGGVHGQTYIHTYIQTNKQTYIQRGYDYYNIDDSALILDMLLC